MTPQTCVVSEMVFVKWCFCCCCRCGGQSSDQRKTKERQPQPQWVLQYEATSYTDIWCWSSCLLLKTVWFIFLFSNLWFKHVSLPESCRLLWLYCNIFPVLKFKWNQWWNSSFNPDMMFLMCFSREEEEVQHQRPDQRARRSHPQIQRPVSSLSVLFVSVSHDHKSDVRFPVDEACRYKYKE